MIGEELKVLGFQKEISSQLNEKDCVDMSVTEMIRYCVMKSQLKLRIAFAMCSSSPIRSWIWVVRVT